MCDERWHNITRSIRLRGAIPMATQEALKQPTWCTLPPDKFEVVVERAPPKLPENILFTYKVLLGRPFALPVHKHRDCIRGCDGMCSCTSCPHHVQLQQGHIPPQL